MRFYDTKAWRRKRKSILARDGHECRECKRYGRSREAKTVHHCNPIETHWEFRLKSWNLISLCFQCHELMHDRESHTLTELGEYWREKVTPKEFYIPPPSMKKYS
ncbi:HNH endonuclease [Ureibacillus sp. FSL W8-0352]|uniref:HNH endonuclease n=1 Tax=Ureibacillus sp. FSL W8-0352 TaxID=2954596 RepID=UPI0030FCEEB9